MAKKKKASSIEELIADKKITAGAINDGICNYSFVIMKGVGMGNTHNIKGSHIVLEDMTDAFRKFNVHLAVVDDVFKHSGVEIKNIDDFHNNELTGLYQVKGFKVKGEGEDESVILTGTKFLSTGGCMELETAKIPIGGMGAYQWYNELKDALEKARKEVMAYDNGKYELPVETEDENPKQLKLADVNVVDVDYEDNSLEKARV